MILLKIEILFLRSFVLFGCVQFNIYVRLLIKYINWSRQLILWTNKGEEKSKHTNTHNPNSGKWVQTDLIELFDWTNIYFCFVCLSLSMRAYVLWFVSVLPMFLSFCSCRCCCFTFCAPFIYSMESTFYFMYVEHSSTRGNEIKFE